MAPLPPSAGVSPSASAALPLRRLSAPPLLSPILKIAIVYILLSKRKRIKKNFIQCRDRKNLYSRRNL